MVVTTAKATTAAIVLASYLLEAQQALQVVAKQAEGNERHTASQALHNIGILLPVLGNFYSDRAAHALLESEGVVSEVEGERFGPGTLQQRGQNASQMGPVSGIVHTDFLSVA